MTASGFLGLSPPSACKFYLKQFNSWLMEEDNVREWVQKKLEKGISEERIKKTLEKTGHDPSLVDRLKSGQAENNELRSEDSGSEEDDPFDSLKYVDDEEETRDTDETDTEQTGNESSFSLPSLPTPSIPSFSLPATDINSRKLLPVVAVVLLVGLGYTGMNLIDGSSPVSNAIKSCEDTGLEVESVGQSGSETIAEVSTSGQSDLVLEIYSGEDLMGETTKTVDGRGIVRLGATGDRAVIYESGCRDRSVERNY